MRAVPESNANAFSPFETLPEPRADRPSRVTVSPFSFPAGTFATTSGAYVVQPAAAGGGAFSGISIHAWVQFPPGDPGLLGVGGDTTLPQGCSYFTQDAYTSPAIFFGSIANWGLRIQ